MRAQEVRVELAEGSVVLRQIPWTKTLLTQNDVQTIVPLGVLISLGYEAYWEKERFTLTDPSGAHPGCHDRRHVPYGCGRLGERAHCRDREKHGPRTG